MKFKSLVTVFEKLNITIIDSKNNVIEIGTTKYDKAYEEYANYEVLDVVNDKETKTTYVFLKED